ncbi:MAG TPA: hypothetical protein VJG83_03305, partial [archaeon]|nr:hypothetical protein [archaeon]
NLDGIDTSFPIGPDGVNILSPTTAKPSTGGARTIRVDFKVGSQVKDYTLKIINGTTTLCSQSGSAPLPLKEQVISPTTCHISMVGSHDVEVSASTADTRKPPKVSRENKAAIIT